jgi:hypothetical protein
MFVVEHLSRPVTRIWLPAHRRDELMPVSIIRKFHGLYNTGNSTSDPQGLAGLIPCILPRDHNHVSFTKAEFVIRDKSSLDRFINRVPGEEMQFASHPEQAEPSDDPILQRPRIDFEKHMFLAIVSHEPNRFVELDIEGVELMSGTIQVLCHFQPGPVQAKVISYGYYCAIIVDRIDGDVAFTRQ